MDTVQISKADIQGCGLKAIWDRIWGYFLRVVRASSGLPVVSQKGLCTKEDEANFFQP